MVSILRRIFSKPSLPGNRPFNIIPSNSIRARYGTREEIQLLYIWKSKVVYLCRNYFYEAFQGYVLTAGPCAALSYTIYSKYGKNFIYSLAEKWQNVQDLLSFIEMCEHRLNEYFNSSVERQTRFIPPSEQAKLIRKPEDYYLQTQIQQQKQEEQSQTQYFTEEQMQIKDQSSNIVDSDSTDPEMQKSVPNKSKNIETLIFSYAIYSILEIPRDICWILTTLYLAKRTRNRRLLQLKK